MPASRKLQALGALFATLLFAMMTAACGRPRTSEAAKPASPPATVQHAVAESELATVTLTPQAVERVGLRTAAVDMRRVASTRTYGGEAVLPPGQLLSVSAPVAGTVTAAGARLPGAGEPLVAGQAILRMTPLLAPERDLRVQLERELASWDARVEAARAREKRTRQLALDRAGSVRAHEEAREALALAEAGGKAAQAQLERLAKAPLEADYRLTVSSPRDGMAHRVHVAAGQTVAAGTPLFEVASLERMWIRVPVYTGELAAVDPRAAARIHGLAQGPGVSDRMAQPVAAPPTADPAAATVDLYYEIDNRDGRLRPGERLGATLSLRGASQGLVVPHSAVLHDAHGGTWVYVQVAAGRYQRRRIEVRNVAGGHAVLARGPARGTPVVAVGAAELFATEFSTSK